MVKSGDEDRFCVPRHEGCERTTVNMLLPKNSSQVSDGSAATTSVSIVLVAVIVALLGIIALVYRR